MSAIISLSQGMRNAVYSMGDIQAQIDTSNKRLATGRKVNDALDNASAYFRAQGYQKDSRDLSGLLDSMDTGLRAIKKATDAMDGARKMVESAQSLARQAVTLGAGDTNRDVYGGQAAELLNQAAKVMNDAGFGGFSLLTTNATAASGLTVVTNISTGAAQTSVVVAAVDMRFGVATGIGGVILNATQGMAVTGGGAGVQEQVAYVVAPANRWSDVAAGNTTANAFIAFTTSALSKLQATGAAVATQGSTIQIRQDFTKSWMRTSNEASDYLLLADMNEEGANLSALQTKQQLAVQALSLASRSDQAILRVFS